MMNRVSKSTMELTEQAFFAISDQLSSLVSQGKSVWNYSSVPLVYTDVVIDGRSMSVEELSEHAIAYKRSGDYAGALSAYHKIIDSCKEQTGKVPIAYIRGLWKVLVSANYFRMAFDISATVFSDIQSSENVNPIERQCFSDYFHSLWKLSVQVVDQFNFSAVKSYAANYSGRDNYHLFRRRSDIKAEIKSIRRDIRRVYGK